MFASVSPRVLHTGQRPVVRPAAGVYDAAAREALIAVKGIGPWTADIYLLMALRRPDVWPEADLALAEGVRRLHHLRHRPTSERLARVASRWSPWRAVAARIVWQFYLRAR